MAATCPPALPIPQHEALLCSEPSSNVMVIRLFGPSAGDAWSLLTMLPTQVSAVEAGQLWPESQLLGMMREKFGSWLFARSASRLVNGTTLRSQRAAFRRIESK